MQILVPEVYKVRIGETEIMKDIFPLSTNNVQSDK